MCACKTDVSSILVRHDADGGLDSRLKLDQKMMFDLYFDPMWGLPVLSAMRSLTFRVD